MVISGPRPSPGQMEWGPVPSLGCGNHSPPGAGVSDRLGTADSGAALAGRAGVACLATVTGREPACQAAC